MKILITGINGFVGKYLAEYHMKNNDSVAGIDMQEPIDDHPYLYQRLSILDHKGMEGFIAQIAPDRVYHLAGVSFLPEAAQSPFAALESNIMGVAALIEACRMSAPKAQILIIGSSREYGTHPEDLLISEKSPLVPDDFYGVSKFSAELVALQYGRQFNLDVRVSRSFNHTGPGQAPRFVCSDWARQAAMIFLNKADPQLTVGDLSPAIDFLDVRDVVRAYDTICSKGKTHTAYNVCSGTAIPLQSIADHFVNKQNKPVIIKQNISKLRTGTSSCASAGDHAKLTQDTGWKPEIPFSQTLDNMFEWWVEHLKEKL